MRSSLFDKYVMVLAGMLIGVGTGLASSHQFENRHQVDEAVQPEVAKSSDQPPPKPWTYVEVLEKYPPTRFHFCAFFGAWGCVVGALVAAGGKWSATLPAGIFGGLLFLLVERAATGMMVDRGFVAPTPASVPLISVVAFIAATAAALRSSVDDRKKPRRKLQEPV